jgi:hypothetical protein
VLSGNRNFEGRVIPDVRANYLASPPLVVAYALAGSIKIDLTKEPLGYGQGRQAGLSEGHLAVAKEIAATIARSVTASRCSKRYADVFEGDANWRKVKVAGGQTYAWDIGSTYVQNPPYFDGMTMSRSRSPTSSARACWRCSAIPSPPTTSRRPVRSRRTAPGRRLSAGAPGAPKDFNSYGARRGNHEVMMRGTFANIRIKNEMVGGVEGGVTKHMPSARDVDLRRRDALQGRGVPLVVFAGKEYGTGSSRDWAAKGTQAARRARRDRRELRAHPPLQPGRHGRAAAGADGTLDGALASANRRGAEKARCVQALLGRYQPLLSQAYGNSRADLEHLRLVSAGTYVNGRPQDVIKMPSIRVVRWSARGDVGSATH